MNLLGLFDATVQTAQDQAQGQPGSSWAAEAGQLRAELVEKRAKASEAEVQLALQGLLDKLGVGRVELLSRDDQRYWSYLSAFSGWIDAAPVRHIGAWFERHGKKWFITSVMSGGPAARAGLVAGDEMISVDGREFAPVASFRDVGAKTGAKAGVRIDYRRLPWGPVQSVQVSTESSSLQASLLRSMIDGVKILRVGDRRVAVIGLPMTTDAAFRAALVAAATTAQIKADAMVLDLRGDYAAAGMTYSEVFLAAPLGKGAQPAVAVAPYGKPLVVLIDAGTSGGRENLAWLLKQQHRATIVGHASAGATAPVQATAIVADRYLLVMPVEIKGQGRVKGRAIRGVNPDIGVDVPHIYAAGHDLALDRALQAAAAL